MYLHPGILSLLRVTSQHQDRQFSIRYELRSCYNNQTACTRAIQYLFLITAPSNQWPKMKIQVLFAVLTIGAHATIDFNKLINGVSSFPVHSDVDGDLNLLDRRQSGTNSAYLDSVCAPNITNPNPIPPCISIDTIQSLCAPNGTTPLAYQASAQCLCNPPSTFFSDWLGCRRCLVTHGGLSEREYNGFSGVLAAASTQLCSGTPTTDFAAIFATATASGGAAQGATTSSDAYPSQSAVSLYYTPPGPQGPGSITGKSMSARNARIAGDANGMIRFSHCCYSLRRTYHKCIGSV